MATSEPPATRTLKIITGEQNSEESHALTWFEGTSAEELERAIRAVLQRAGVQLSAEDALELELERGGGAVAVSGALPTGTTLYATIKHEGLVNDQAGMEKECRVALASGSIGGLEKARKRLEEMYGQDIHTGDSFVGSDGAMMYPASAMVVARTTMFGDKSVHSICEEMEASIVSVAAAAGHAREFPACQQIWASNKVVFVSGEDSTRTTVHNPRTGEKAVELIVSAVCDARGVSEAAAQSAGQLISRLYMRRNSDQVGNLSPNLYAIMACLNDDKVAVEPNSHDDASVVALTNAMNSARRLGLVPKADTFRVIRFESACEAFNRDPGAPLVRVFGRGGVYITDVAPTARWACGSVAVEAVVDQYLGSLQELHGFKRNDWIRLIRYGIMQPRLCVKTESRDNSSTNSGTPCEELAGWKNIQGTELMVRHIDPRLHCTMARTGTLFLSQPHTFMGMIVNPTSITEAGARCTKYKISDGEVLIEICATMTTPGHYCITLHDGSNALPDGKSFDIRQFKKKILQCQIRQSSESAVASVGGSTHPDEQPASATVEPSPAALAAANPTAASGTRANNLNKKDGQLAAEAELSTVASYEESIGGTKCNICNSGDNEATMLLCDGLASDMLHECESAGHLTCVGLVEMPGKNQQWYCPECNSSIEEALEYFDRYMKDQKKMDKTRTATLEEFVKKSGLSKSVIDKWLSSRAHEIGRFKAATTHAMIRLHVSMNKKKKSKPPSCASKRRCVTEKTSGHTSSDQVEKDDHDEGVGSTGGVSL